MGDLSKQQFSSFVSVDQKDYYTRYRILLDCRGYNTLTVTSSANYFWVYEYDYNIPFNETTQTPLGNRNQQVYDISNIDFVMYYITCSVNNNGGWAANTYVLS